MLLKKIFELLEKREFVAVATCDFSGRPNAAPKFLLKTENDFIYLVDYTIGMTWDNIKINPKVSLSLIDPDTLIGYQVNGSVEIIDKGPEYNTSMDEFKRKGVGLSVQRIVEGIYRGKRHETFEVSLPERFVVLKVKVNDFAEIGPHGELKKEKI